MRIKEIGGAKEGRMPLEKRKRFSLEGGVRLVFIASLSDAQGEEAGLGSGGLHEL